MAGERSKERMRAMTPLQIEMLLHYYSRADDYRDGDFSAPAVQEALEGFKRDELLAADQAGPPRTCYVITERGRVYVEALRAVPMPERRWVMPSMHLPPGPQPDPLLGWRPA